jgi:hypothetical protein
MEAESQNLEYMLVAYGIVIMFGLWLSIFGTQPLVKSKKSLARFGEDCMDMLTLVLSFIIGFCIAVCFAFAIAIVIIWMEMEGFFKWLRGITRNGK